MSDTPKGKKFFEMTKEELSKCGKAGGKKSAEVRRAKREMKEIIDIVMNTPMKSGRLTNAEDIKNFASLKGKNIDVQTAIIVAQVQRALKGDVQSATFLRDTAGQKPTNAVDVSVDLPVIISGESEIDD